MLHFGFLLIYTLIVSASLSPPDYVCKKSNPIPAAQRFSLEHVKETVEAACKVIKNRRGMKKISHKLQILKYPDVFDTKRLTDQSWREQSWGDQYLANKKDPRELWRSWWDKRKGSEVVYRYPLLREFHREGDKNQNAKNPESIFKEYNYYKEVRDGVYKNDKFVLFTMTKSRCFEFGVVERVEVIVNRPATGFGCMGSTCETVRKYDICPLEEITEEFEASMNNPNSLNTAKQNSRPNLPSDSWGSQSNRWGSQSDRWGSQSDRWEYTN